MGVWGRVCFNFPECQEEPQRGGVSESQHAGENSLGDWNTGERVGGGKRIYRVNPGG